VFAKRIRYYKKYSLYCPDFQNDESQFWHFKAVEIACLYLPSNCLLTDEIMRRYMKHYDPNATKVKNLFDIRMILNNIKT
jgi:hypothetical protein